MPATHILAIDQGTTSTRAIVYDRAGREVAAARAEFPQYYPGDGWVEHDPEAIWQSVCATVPQAIAEADLTASDIAAIGITNQRETTLLWDRATGVPVANAIVWQDRRTAARCAELKADGHEVLVRSKTGLLLDPYFSATKLAWLLDNVAGARGRAEAGELAFGTIDSFLLWRLTEGRVHATDATNASRTMLFDIHRQRWSPTLLALFGIPAGILPEVRDCAGRFGTATLLGAPIPICGIAGDQQAALFGQACFAPGDVKATYGTGGFILMNTGGDAVLSDNRLLTTVGYRLDGHVTYALEGSIFVAGAAIKWLRDGLGLVIDAAQTGDMAASLSDNGGVYMVPAFVGLGAPHWQADARGLIAGLTLDSGPAHIARAALEAAAYQTRDLTNAMIADGAAAGSIVRVDGGMAANDWLCQFLADMLQTPVERPDTLETTALGAAYLAGIGAGLWSGTGEVAALRGGMQRFSPAMTADQAEQLLSGWRRALARAL